MRSAPARLLLAGLLLAVIAACAPAPPSRAVWDAAWRWRQPADSLSTTAFRNLPALERDARRDRARALRRAADAAPTYADAAAALVGAAGLDPDDPALWTRLADACTRVGDHDRALRCLDAAAAALAAVPAAERPDLALDLVLRRALVHRDRGEWSQARAWADTAAARQPQEPRVLTVQGLALADHGDVQGAVNAAVRLETAHPTWFEWRWVRGMASLTAGDVEAAYHWLRDARPEQPYSARFWHDLATVCERLELETEADRYYGYSHAALGLPRGTTLRLVTAVPAQDGDTMLQLPIWSALDGWPAAGSSLGWALAAADSALTAVAPARRAFWTDRASGLLSVCIRRERGARRARELRGLVYAAAGADDLAREDLRRALTEAPSPRDVDPRVPAVQGHLLLKAGRWQPAVTVLRRAVEVEPANAQAWADYGLSLLMLRRLEAGEEALGRAMALDPELPAPWYNRGLARVHAGRWVDAVADLERALELAPGNEEIDLLLKQAAQQVRRRER
ncbi:MAG TPA: tetratricopeptide repeat protein [Candidatus Krumholzibacteria bacterium]|nr:tetratricopeptide repeat protein [Candidatus Krumholzibacteria bacterium]HRX50769.1 tetratricopeptide repeat protein [Candidatus Krumholzibacteria bacterium]